MGNDDSLAELTPPTAASPTPTAPAPASPAAASPAAAPPAPPAAPAPAKPAPVTSTSPTVVQPQRRGGLAGIVDEFRDAIAGTTTSKVFTDADGNKYIKHPNLTHGQQWVRIAADAIAGAGAGAAAGQGRGGGMAPAARGFNAGMSFAQKQAQQQREVSDRQNEEVKQAQLSQFNAVKLKHDVAANEFTLQRLKVNATHSDITFAQQQLDRERKLGSADLGVYKDEADLARVQEQQPDFWKHVYANNVVSVPEVNEKGERTGIHLFLRTPGVGAQPVEPGTSIKVFTPGKQPNDPPTLVDQVPTVPMTHDMVDAYNNAAQSKYQQWFKDKGEQNFKAAQTEHTQALTAKTKGVDTTKAEADTERANAATAKLKSETPQVAPGNLSLRGEEYLATLKPEQASLVREIRTGRMAPERISYLLGRGQSKESASLMAAVAQAYPGEVDTSKLAAYPKTYADYTSGKTSVTLESGGTALVHLHELQQLNTVMSHVAHMPAWTAYQNKADTVAHELAKFYGNPTIPAINGIKDTLTSTLPGNRASAIRTQAKSMSDKFNSLEQKWKNAAPSELYEAPLPKISEDAKQARAALDPEYAQRLKTETAAAQRPKGVPNNWVHRSDGPHGSGWYDPNLTPGK